MQKVLKDKFSSSSEDEAIQKRKEFAENYGEDNVILTQARDGSEIWKVEAYGKATVPAEQEGTIPAGQEGTIPAGQGGTIPAGQGGTIPAGQEDPKTDGDKEEEKPKKSLFPL